MLAVNVLSYMENKKSNDRGEVLIVLIGAASFVLIATRKGVTAPCGGRQDEQPDADMFWIGASDVLHVLVDRPSAIFQESDYVTGTILDNECIDVCAVRCMRTMSVVFSGAAAKTQRTGCRSNNVRNRYSGIYFIDGQY